MLLMHSRGGVGGEGIEIELHFNVLHSQIIRGDSYEEENFETESDHSRQLKLRSMFSFLVVISI